MTIVKFIINTKTVAGSLYTALIIVVDGKPLAEIMKEIEMPMAEKEGHPNLAGNYAGAIDVPKNPTRYFLREDEADWGEQEDKTVLLNCACGWSGCYPLLCKIEVYEDTVVWSEFQNWQRNAVE